MRWTWLGWAGICLSLVACSSDSSKKVACADESLCQPDAGAEAEAGVPDSGMGGAPDVAPDGEAGSPSEAGAAGAGQAELQVTIVGAGTVAVSAAAACIESPCQYPTAPGAALELEAKPSADSRFVGWSGDCSGTSAKTTVTVTGALECVATFVVEHAVSLTVDASGGGSVTTDPDLACDALGCSGEVDDHSSVSLLATASPGFRFLGWVGSPECDGSTDASLAFDVTEDIACTAKFGAQYTVSVTAAGANADVSVTAGSCTATTCTADAGSSASFSAAPLAGYRFTGWSGSSVCTGSVNPLPITNISSNIACVANYAARFKVTGLVGGGLTGSVVATSPSSSAACLGNACTVDSRASVNLVAPVIAGHRLTSWTGVGCTASGTATPTTGDLTCTANYALGVSVTGTVVGATGSVVATSASPGAACLGNNCSIDAGGTVTLTTPNLLPGFRFKGWAGAGCSGTALTLALSNVQSSISCTANYVAEYVILAKANAGGTASAAVAGVACAANSCTVDAGTTVALTAKADTANGYHFTSWTGANCVPAANDPLTLSNVSQSATCTASFALSTFVIAATAGANGSVTATRDTGAVCAGNSCNVNFGTSVTLAATPALHYHFLAWTGAGCPPTPASLTLKNLNASCAANFTSDTFAATVSASPAGGGSVGISCPAGNCGAVPYGQPVNVTATPSAGWSFSSWSANCNGGAASPNAVTIVGTTACVASFRPTVVGTVSPSGAGTITASGAPNGVCTSGNPANCVVDLGGTVTLVAKAATDAVFTGWSGDCTVKTATATLSAVTTPKTCTANFYQLWAQATGSANADGMTNVTTLADGTVVGLGPSTVTRASNRLALVNLNANSGALGQNQAFADSAGTGAFAALGLSTTSNQKNVIALGAHRSANATLPWLHNEQTPAWDFEYAYSNGGTATGAGGEVITTLDGGYAFAVGITDPKLGVMAHLTKLDASGKPLFDVQFCAADANGGCLPTQPFDLMQDPAAKYFTVLSQVTNANVETLLTFIDETGKVLGSTRYADKNGDLHALQFVPGSAADTFLVVGWRANPLVAGSLAFFAELSRAGSAPTIAVSLGTASQLSSVVRTAAGYALAGVFTDAKLGSEAWLVLSTSAGAVSSQQAYSGSGDERLNSIATVPAGGFALGGASTTWGAGASDMWTLRVDGAGALTFNAASAATRYPTTFAATAISSLFNSTVLLVTQGSTATASAPAVTASATGFTQVAEAP